MYGIDLLELSQRGWQVFVQFHHGEKMASFSALYKARQDMPRVGAVELS